MPMRNDFDFGRILSIGIYDKYNFSIFSAHRQTSARREHDKNVSAFLGGMCIT